MKFKSIQCKESFESLPIVLFVYGTLQKPEMQRAVFGREATLEAAVLPNYKKDIVNINKRDYPMAIPAENYAIQGGNIQVSSAEIIHIDQYETDAYVRARAVLASGAICFAYVKP